MTDLNTAIAAFKGWEYSARGFDLGAGSDMNFPYRNKLTGKFSAGCPDFQRDANLYMELFEEMGQETDEHEPYDVHLTFMDGSFTVAIVARGYDYEADDYTYNSIASVDGDTIGTAICLAYCRLKGIEVVG
jgi:hypothetical protein